MIVAIYKPERSDAELKGDSWVVFEYEEGEILSGSIVMINYYEGYWSEISHAWTPEDLEKRRKIDVWNVLTIAAAQQLYKTLKVI